MAEEIMLNNYSDDSRIKQYIQNVLMPQVFKNIPITTLNAGGFSIFSEYMSQAIENMSFTSSFYFNESFITKAVLPDSIYSEAAIFNIGYAFATPSSCNFLLELKIEDIIANAKLNADTGLFEFILDKDTRFNLSNGSVYSLDYDILIQFKNVDTAKKNKAWNVSYIMDESNSIAVNKNTYIMHRVTDVWLCLMVNASEYTREVHEVVNNTLNNVPNTDTVISCTDHICGFDIKYIDSESRKTGVNKYIARDHILPIHSNVSDDKPYVHYIMDNPQTIRFMWQLNGNKYFTPETNSSYEITIYTCHGEAANFSAFNNEDQPNVITASTRYADNSNVMKAAFVISGSLGGTNIGTTETVRRETIQAYNTANVLSTDHDLYEWFKTFYFKNVLYPFFFKRRDDPWGRLWSGYIALKDTDDYVFKTNTLHMNIPYEVLYNNDADMGNEIIIPPGWVWTYRQEDTEDKLYTVIPYTQGDGKTVESANTFKYISDKFVFANPFGIRIQKYPFAIGYFNPWINETITATRMNVETKHKKFDEEAERNGETDLSLIYHAFPIITNIKRTYLDNYYKITSIISPTIATTSEGKALVQMMKENSVLPVFSESMWRYFKEPTDMYASLIPILSLSGEERYLPFNPDRTYICARRMIENTSETDKVTLDDIWIEDGSVDPDFPRSIDLSLISGTGTTVLGSKSLWKSERLIEVLPKSDNIITCESSGKAEGFDDKITFARYGQSQYYTMSTNDDTLRGHIQKIVVDKASPSSNKSYNETFLYMIGSPNQTVTINIMFANSDNYITYRIINAKNVFIPYDEGKVVYNEETSKYEFDFSNIEPNGIFLYADMFPSPDTGIAEYYKIKLKDIEKNEPAFYYKNQILDTSKNDMRVILHTFLNGAETGRIEMTPVTRENDGSYRFEANMYPLNQLVDADNRINIASMNYGGGAWTSTSDQMVVVDATNPEFRITILMKSIHEDRESEIVSGDEFTGYRIADVYKLEDIQLIQELKEMRSVVNFGDATPPTQDELSIYNEFNKLIIPDDEYQNLYDINAYIEDTINGKPSSPPDAICDLALTMSNKITYLLDRYNTYIDESKRNKDASKTMQSIIDDLTSFSQWDKLHQVISLQSSNVVICYYYDGRVFYDQQHQNPIPLQEGIYYYDEYNKQAYISSYGPTVEPVDLLVWYDLQLSLQRYSPTVNELFVVINVNSGVVIQLAPLVEYSLMNTKRFESFISSFTQVHKAIEPVIFQRIDGNNYLDTKLIATYGLPHTYTTEYHRDQNDNVFWPDLNIQMEFDIALKNQSIASDTISNLKSIIKGYFNKITNVHTAADRINMDSNIYISELTRRMLDEKTNNVTYLKFVGWYTNDRFNSSASIKKDTKFMDANVQSIVQKWKSIDDFPTTELERFTPEMFILEDDNIVFNIIQ